MKDDNYSKEKVNEFALRCLGGREAIEVTEIPYENSQTAVMLLLVELYSQYKDVDYEVTFKNDEVEVGNYTVQSFRLAKKERSLWHI